jgi:hypothetical protein
MPSAIRGESRRKAARHPLVVCLPAAILSVALFPLPAARAVEVYKWVDSTGKVHYGDRADAAPGGRKMEIDTKVPPPDPQRAVHDERSRKLLNDIEQDRQDEQAQAAALKAKQQKRKRRCIAARQRLDKFEHANYLYKTDMNGERHILTDAEYSKALTQARQDVSTHCGAVGDDR